MSTSAFGVDIRKVARFRVGRNSSRLQRDALTTKANEPSGTSLIKQLAVRLLTRRYYLTPRRGLLVVRLRPTGFEPVRPYERQHLKLVGLPNFPTVALSAPSGKRGIRTPGGVTHAGLANRWLKPLTHLSKVIKALVGEEGLEPP